MAGNKLQNFGGMIPAADPTLLPPTGAEHSENTWLYSGRLRGFPTHKFVRNLLSTTTKVYRIPNNVPDAQHMDDSVWVEFQDANTDIVRSPVIDDTFERYYFASKPLAPTYNTKARIGAGDPAFKLGIPAPTAPGVASSGGTGTDVTRAYLCTWVSAYGEEGPAGAPTLHTGKDDDTWTITIPAAAAGDLGTDRNLTKVRIYRTITSSGGIATYFQVAELDIATASYDDTASDDTVALNSQLESTNWTAPPADLAGFVLMPNGILAGFRKNEIWFSEPYRPHAWPVTYVLTVDYPVVGLGVVDQTLIVCTQGYPWTITGVHPATMSQARSASFEPCMSRGSIVQTAEGVYYASPHGLVYAGGGAIQNITAQLVTKDKWQTFMPLVTLQAAVVGNAYYGFGTLSAGVFNPDAFNPDAFAQDDFTGAYIGMLIDPHDARVAFNLMSDRTPVVSVFNDIWSGEIFVIKDSKLYRVDTINVDPTPQVYKWRSKKFESSVMRNIGAMRMRWREPGNVPTPTVLPKPILDDANVEFPTLPAGVKGYVRAYADEDLVWERELRTSGELMRLPSGFKATYYQFEFETYLDIVSVDIAATVKELGTV